MFKTVGSISRLDFTRTRSSTMNNSFLYLAELRTVKVVYNILQVKGLNKG